MLAIINGPGGVRKDEFIHCVKFLLSDKVRVFNFSLITPVKRLFGAISEKTPEYRFLLEQTLVNWMRFNGSPLNELFEKVDMAMASNEPYLIFCHIRQGEYIRRVLDRYGEDNVITIHVDSIRAETPATEADRNTRYFGYTHEIRNDGNLDDLMRTAESFLKNIGMLT